MLIGKLQAQTERAEKKSMPNLRSVPGLLLLLLLPAWAELQRALQEDDCEASRMHGV